MIMDDLSNEQLHITMADLRGRLEEAEQMIQAIKAGEVDAFAIQHGDQASVFTIQSADYAYRVLIENISEGAVNITEDGLIVFCNKYFHEMLGLPYEKVVGNFIHDFIHPGSIDDFQLLFVKALAGQSKGEISLRNNGHTIQVYVSLTSLYPHLPTVGVIVSNLTEKQEYDKAAAEKNKFIETLLDISPDLIMVLDRDLRFISFNNKAINHFHFPTERDGLGKLVTELIPNLEACLELEALQDALRGDERYLPECDVFKNGRFYDMYAVPIRNAAGIYAVMMTLRDVTEEATSKLKLEERNAFIETIIEASHEMIAVFDTDMVLLTMNKAAEEHTGLKKEDVLGKSLYAIYPGAAGIKFEKDLRQALQGEFVSNEAYASILSDRTIRNYMTPLRDSDGKIYAALIIAQDITDIARWQAALQKSQEHFKSLFSVSPVAKSITCQLDGTILNVNPAWEKMFKRTKEDVVGKTMESIGLSGTQRDDGNESASKKSYATAHGIDLEYTLANGKKIFAYTNSVKIEMDGRPALLSATIDTTQRRKDEEKIRKAKEQLEEQNELLEQINNELASFTYIASHDLQEPLRKIQTFSHRILEKEGDQFSQLTRSYFDRIVNAASRMQALIADLLNYSRTNSSASDFVPTDLNVVMREVRENLRELIIENKVSLKIGPLPTVNAIPIQASQLFSNLLINSIKYRRENVRPEIDVEARLVKGVDVIPDLTSSDDLFWEIRVRDNGIGFDPQHEDRIFGLFQRLHGKTEYEGTGIGLAICKKIVDNHKGYITATGKPGEGAEFTVYWPAHNKHDEVKSNHADR
jgi:PAS domain S-box-containing protein